MVDSNKRIIPPPPPLKKRVIPPPPPKTKRIIPPPPPRKVEVDIIKKEEPLLEWLDKQDEIEKEEVMTIWDGGPHLPGYGDKDLPF